MTRSPVILAALLVLAAAVVLAGSRRDAGASGIWGDVAGGDAEVTIADAHYSILCAAGIDTQATCGANGDVDCDGEYTANDTLLIIAYVAGNPLPTPAGCLPVGAYYEPSPTPASSTAPPSVSPPPGPTHTPTPTATQDIAPSVTPTPTATPQASPSPTPTPTPDPTTSPTQQPSPGQTPKMGVEPACQVFPADNWWNTDISNYPMHPNSDGFVDGIGRNTHLHPDFGTVWDGKPIGIPYVIVGAGQPKVPITYYYDDSDPGPYPIPPDAPVEGQPVGQPNTADFGGDRHVIVVDESTCTLYETFDSWPVNGGESWDTGSAAIFDFGSNALRPDYWTSADAAGLPIFAGLVRYSEVVGEGEIDHALRFTVSQTRRAFIHPATHFASDLTDPDLPPMGLRFRMKASYDCTWASSEVQVICAALKKYGMFVADNGADWYISGAPDSRWDDDRLGDLKDITGDAFEVVDTGEAVITEE